MESNILLPADCLFALLSFNSLSSKEEKARAALMAETKAATCVLSSKSTAAAEILAEIRERRRNQASPVSFQMLVADFRALPAAAPSSVCSRKGNFANAELSARSVLKPLHGGAIMHLYRDCPFVRGHVQCFDIVPSSEDGEARICHLCKQFQDACTAVTAGRKPHTSFKEWPQSDVARDVLAICDSVVSQSELSWTRMMEALSASDGHTSPESLAKYFNEICDVLQNVAVVKTRGSAPRHKSLVAALTSAEHMQSMQAPSQILSAVHPHLESLFERADNTERQYSVDKVVIANAKLRLRLLAEVLSRIDDENMVVDVLHKVMKTPLLTTSANWKERWGVAKSEFDRRLRLVV